MQTLDECEHATTTATFFNNVCVSNLHLTFERLTRSTSFLGPFSSSLDKNEKKGSWELVCNAAHKNAVQSVSWLHKSYSRILIASCKQMRINRRGRTFGFYFVKEELEKQRAKQ